MKLFIDILLKYFNRVIMSLIVSRYMVPKPQNVSSYIQPILKWFYFLDI